MSGYKRRFLTKRNIFRRPGELYLVRYILIHTPWIGIYLHNFMLSDYDVPHDHPWNFFSLPLTKGYREHLPDGTSIWRRPFSPKFRTAGEFHWVELANGRMWTLFIRFRSRRKWGFLTKDGWIHHDIYNESLGIKEDN